MKIDNAYFFQLAVEGDLGVKAKAGMDVNYTGVKDVTMSFLKHLAEDARYDQCFFVIGVLSSANLFYVV